MAFEKKEYNVGGIRVHAYNKTGTLGGSISKKPVVVLFALHGRLGAEEDMERTAYGALEFAQTKENEEEAQRDLIVVTFDHRNHGLRIVDQKSNYSWNTKNPEQHNERHAIDMYSIQVGTAADVSFLIDFLPAYIFPNDEREITEWAMIGVSLGGHSTWLALKNEPRLRVGIPVIGCPDYINLIRGRTKAQGLKFAPPYVPASLEAAIQRFDPSNAQVKAADPGVNPFYGKRILVLSGADDTLVPWPASRGFVDALEVGPEGKKEVRLLEGTKHEYTEAMRQEIYRFVWEEVLHTR